MKLAPEGKPQMFASTIVLGSAIAASVIWFWPAAVPLVLVWGWSIAFFRDPERQEEFATGELCSPADGTVADIDRLEHYDPIDGPALRVGIFLSLFNVHINRAACAGTVLSTAYRKGKFYAAMQPEAAEHNESNTLVIDPSPPLPGPIVLRQIAGMAARRIVCHAKPQTRLAVGERFGLIKFGSRTELIVPAREGTEVLVQVGDKVQAGVTCLVRQAVDRERNVAHDRRAENVQRETPTATSQA